MQWGNGLHEFLPSTDVIVFDVAFYFFTPTLYHASTDAYFDVVAHVGI